jgi:hypothetical protein
MESAGVRTSRVTVFTAPPRNVIFEVGDQLIRRSKSVDTFPLTEMPVIALPNFVVVA